MASATSTVGSFNYDWAEKLDVSCNGMADAAAHADSFANATAHAALEPLPSWETVPVEDCHSFGYHR